MFVNAGSLPQDTTLDADIVIVGTGPAGLVLARQLIGRGLRIVMLESGGAALSRDVQMLYRAEIAGAPNHPGTHSRYRVYGGSTTRWGGQCVPLEPLDLEPRPGIPDTGWPFGFDELAPWYDNAAKLLGLRGEGFSVPAWEDRVGALPPIANGEITASAIAFAQPLDLGAAWRSDLDAAEDVTVVLGANALEVETDTMMQRATGIRFARRDGTVQRATGRRIVLACGGIENARLLLASQTRSDCGVGNTHGTVGRYFLDHPYLMPGWLDPATPEYDRGWHVIETFEGTAAAPGGHAVFTLDPALRRREALPACVGYFMRREAWQLRRSYVARGGAALTHFAEIARGERVRDEDLLCKGSDLVVGAPSTLATLGGWAAAAIHPVPRAALRICLEATPNPDSRITLSERRDALNQPLARVDWNLNARDWEALHRFRAAFAKAIQGAGVGRLVYDTATDVAGYPLSMTGGRHHMGATRMHDDPKRGVVDANLRVHGMGNLYVAGSSVFPTGGWANPTFTIVALSLRLAAHLCGSK